MPSVLSSLLFYRYITGKFSLRKIEKTTYEQLIFQDSLEQEYSGEFGFATWPEAHVQFDDLVIRLIEK